MLICFLSPKKTFPAFQQTMAPSLGQGGKKYENVHPNLALVLLLKLNEAECGNLYCLPFPLDYIVMQLRKTNSNKGYSRK